VDITHWIIMGVVVVVLVGLTILRIGMRRGRGGPGYIVFRVLLALAVLGFVGWRYWSSTHH
jgi:hypothetical protein